MRDAVSNKERWKGRHTPPQDPSANNSPRRRIKQARATRRKHRAARYEAALRATASAKQQLMSSYGQARLPGTSQSARIQFLLHSEAATFVSSGKLSTLMWQWPSATRARRLVPGLPLDLI